MTINDWKIFDNKKQPEIYFEVTDKAIQPGKPISCYLELDGNSAIGKHCKVYMLARETESSAFSTGSRPFLYDATAKEWNVFSEAGSVISVLPEPYFEGLVPDINSGVYKSYFDLPPLPEGDWKIEMVLEVEQTTLLVSSGDEISVQEEKVIPVKPAPPSWPDIFPPIPDEPKPDPTPEPSSPPTDDEDADNPSPFYDGKIHSLVSGKPLFLNFSPWQWTLCKFSGTVGPDMPIQVSNTPQSGQPRTVHMLVKKGNKPTINDFARTWSSDPSHWDFEAKKYLPQKSALNEDFYWKYNIGSQAEFVEIYGPVILPFTFYVLVYNRGAKSVKNQRILLGE
jgi:hypothetical protein